MGNNAIVRKFDPREGGYRRVRRIYCKVCVLTAEIPAQRLRWRELETTRPCGLVHQTKDPWLPSQRNKQAVCGYTRDWLHPRKSPSGIIRDGAELEQLGDPNYYVDCPDCLQPAAS